MCEEEFQAAVEKLQGEFPVSFNRAEPIKGGCEKMYRWPGDPDEDIIVVVHKSGPVREPFHRHDYFYFNYTYKGQYDTLSYKYDNQITVYEHELYAGQPFSGHALCVHDNHETIIIGVLIQRQTFFRTFLPMLSSDSRLFRFFIDPETDCHSQEYIHFRLADDCFIRTLLEMMVIEYADPEEETQEVLKPLTLAFLTQIPREYVRAQTPVLPKKPSDRIVQYMGEHFDNVTLTEVARRFSYHPNYVSTLLRQDYGKSFSDILLGQRMERAAALLKGTELPVSEIGQMVGYGNSSNFYKAFREYYGVSPRGFAKQSS